MTINVHNIRQLFNYREDGELTWKIRPAYCIQIGDVAGSYKTSGHKELMYKGKTYLVHRLIFLLHHGHLPSLVDHRDRNPKNNRIDNLREATHAENMVNSTKVQGKNPARGVVITRSGNFLARFRQSCLGTFKTLEEAVAAYTKARDEAYPGIVN